MDGEPNIVHSVVLDHKWVERSPRWLYGRSLRVRWRLYDDGAVTSKVVAVLDAKGERLSKRLFPWACWDEDQERTDSGRRVVLAGPLDPDRLCDWLIAEGIADEGS